MVLDDSQQNSGGLPSYFLTSHYRKAGQVGSRTALIPTTSLGMIEFLVPFSSAPSAFEIERNRDGFCEAIKALSARLGGDEWFLGSR
jgi:hypothetical protein